MVKKITPKTKIKAYVKTQIYGFLLFLPWLIGFLLFFVAPFFITLRFSFNRLSINPHGAGLVFDYVGLKNYAYIFGEYKIKTGQFFIRYLFNSLTEVAILLPSITVFALIFAVLLNQKFKGRGIARVLFFIPIIFGLPGVVNAFTSLANMEDFTVSLKDNRMFNLFNIMNLFENAPVLPGFFNIVTGLVKGTFKIIMLSGVQILIFLAAIQSINPSLYEVAEIEGASKYEQFFKITLPSIFPILSAVVIYTLIDLLYRSPITKLITLTELSIEHRATIAMIFTLVTIGLLFLVVLFLKLSSGGHYERKRLK